MMQDRLEQNLQKISTWKRLFYMLIYAAIAGLVRLLIWAVILLQLGSMLITGDVNLHILSFGRSLSAYLYHLYLFLTFSTDELAFPFASWNLYKEPDLLKLRLRS